MFKCFNRVCNESYLSFLDNCGLLEHKFSSFEKEFKKKIVSCCKTCSEKSSHHFCK